MLGTRYKNSRHGRIKHNLSNREPFRGNSVDSGSLNAKVRRAEGFFTVQSDEVNNDHVSETDEVLILIEERRGESS